MYSGWRGGLSGPLASSRPVFCRALTVPVQAGPSVFTPISCLFQIHLDFASARLRGATDRSDSSASWSRMDACHGKHIYMTHLRTTPERLIIGNL